jgi:hypothetical protein
VHYERDGEAATWLLDIVEVPKRHTGLQLAKEFVRILEEFDLVAKVSSITTK